jgi:hypothetical protein
MYGLTNSPTVNIIITMVVMNEDQKWFWSEDGSYVNEPSQPTFSRVW